MAVALSQTRCDMPTDHNLEASARSWADRPSWNRFETQCLRTFMSMKHASFGKHKWRMRIQLHPALNRKSLDARGARIPKYRLKIIRCHANSFVISSSRAAAAKISCTTHTTRLVLLIKAQPLTRSHYGEGHRSTSRSGSYTTLTQEMRKDLAFPGS